MSVPNRIPVFNNERWEHRENLHTSENELHLIARLWGLYVKLWLVYTLQRNNFLQKFFACVFSLSSKI